MKYLSYLERKSIEKMLKEKSKIREIARVLKRSHSTIIYEIRVNKNRYVKEYNADKAHERFLKRQNNKGNKSKLEMNPKLKQFVINQMILEQWSPEQIAGFPFPIKVIQTDNGTEFTWRLQPGVTKTHPFTLQCQLYGYEHHLIPPAYPRANSHVERTHRTDEEYVYRGRTFTSLAQLTKINLKTLKDFNEKHPQKTKHFMTPLEFGILKYQLHKQKLNYSVLNV